MTFANVRHGVCRICSNPLFQEILSGAGEDIRSIIITLEGASTALGDTDPLNWDLAVDVEMNSRRSTVFSNPPTFPPEALHTPVWFPTDIT